MRGLCCVLGTCGHSSHAVGLCTGSVSTHDGSNTHATRNPEHVPCVRASAHAAAPAHALAVHSPLPACKEKEKKAPSGAGGDPREVSRSSL